MLLDICLVFTVTNSERIFSRDLVGRLVGNGERPWGDLRKGKPVTETWLAQQLRPYGIRPTTIRVGGQVAKGYAQEDFIETFKRYIPKSEVEELKAELRERTMIEKPEQVKTQAPEGMRAETAAQVPRERETEASGPPKTQPELSNRLDPGLTG